MFVPLVAAIILAAGPAPSGDVGPLVRALWLFQRDGTAAAVDPANDAQLKGTLAKALAQRWSPDGFRAGRIHDARSLQEAGGP